MNKLSKPQDDQLLEYLDGTLTPEEKTRLEQEIFSSAELQNRLAELRRVTTALQRVELQQPSKNFTQLVMERLDQYPVRAGLTMRNGILLLTGVLVAIGLGSLLLAAGIFDAPSAIINLNELGLESKYIKQPLPSIPVNGKLVVNIIIMLNIALAFILLDRTILRPWFEQRLRHL
jgi:hypothetical protein